jgi:uncharacterized protein UPF0182
MTDPQTFYNREDLWNIAQERYGDRVQQMQAYYTTLRLPGEATTDAAPLALGEWSGGLQSIVGRFQPVLPCETIEPVRRHRLPPLCLNWGIDSTRCAVAFEV